MVPTANEQAWTLRLMEAARSGEVLDLAPEESDRDIDPAGAISWPPERCLPAKALRATLLDPDLKPDPSGLCIRGAHLTGELTLVHATIPCPLVLTHSAAEHPPGIEFTALPRLDLTGTHLPGLRLAGTHVHGDAVLERLIVIGGIEALGMHVGGHLNLRRTTVTNRRGVAIDLDGARVGGTAVLKNMTVTGEVRAQGVRVGGQLNLRAATIQNEGGLALGLDGARVDGNTVLAGLQATGELRALGADLGGQLDLTGATLTNKGGIVLGLDGCRVNGAAIFKGLTAIGNVHVVHAQFGGQLNFAGATLTNNVGAALVLQETEMNTLWLRGIGRVHGQVILGGAQLGALVVDEKVPDAGLPGPLRAAGWRVRDVQGGFVTIGARPPRGLTLTRTSSASRGMSWRRYMSATANPPMPAGYIGRPPGAPPEPHPSTRSRSAGCTEPSLGMAIIHWSPPSGSRSSWEPRRGSPIGTRRPSAPPCPPPPRRACCPCRAPPPPRHPPGKGRSRGIPRASNSPPIHACIRCCTP